MEIPWGLERIRKNMCFWDSLGQNIVDKLMKLSKVDFSIECFTVDFLQFSRPTVKIYFLGWSGCSPSVLSISWIYLIFTKFISL